MATVDLQTVISSPPDAVFEALGDLSRRPVLDPTVSEITPPQGTIELGSSFGGRGTFTGSNSGFDGTVTAWEPVDLIGLGFTTRNGARLVEEWRLRGVPSGTLVTYHAELKLPGGLLGKLLDRVMVGNGFRKQREAVLARVKARLEQASALE